MFCGRYVRYSIGICFGARSLRCEESANAKPPSTGSRCSQHRHHLPSWRHGYSFFSVEGVCRALAMGTGGVYSNRERGTPTHPPTHTHTHPPNPSTHLELLPERFHCCLEGRGPLFHLFLAPRRFFLRCAAAQGVQDTLDASAVSSDSLFTWVTRYHSLFLQNNSSKLSQITGNPCKDICLLRGLPKGH